MRVSTLTVEVACCCCCWSCWSCCCKLATSEFAPRLRPSSCSSRTCSCSVPPARGVACLLPCQSTRLGMGKRERERERACEDVGWQRADLLLELLDLVAVVLQFRCSTQGGRSARGAQWIGWWIGAYRAHCSAALPSWRAQSASPSSSCASRGCSWPRAEVRPRRRTASRTRVCGRRNSRSA